MFRSGEYVRTPLRRPSGTGQSRRQAFPHRRNVPAVRSATTRRVPTAATPLTFPTTGRARWKSPCLPGLNPDDTTTLSKLQASGLGFEPVGDGGAAEADASGAAATDRGSARTKCSSTSTTSPSGTDQEAVEHQDQWITSNEPTHESSSAASCSMPPRASSSHTRAATCTPRRAQHYVLSGLMRFGVCGRRMQGHWSHGRAYYRCKFTEDYPDRDADHPRNIYVKEDALIPGLDGWLADALRRRPHRRHLRPPRRRLRARPRGRAAGGQAASRHRRLRPQARQLPRACSTTRTP